MLDLNRKAVMLMHEGAYAEAYNLLHASMDELKAKIDRELTTPSADEMGSSEVEAAIHPIPVRFAANSEQVVNNAFSFYSSAFIFSGSEDELKSTSSNEVRLAAVVLYNFGLCFHVNGINRAASKSYFAKALQMYTTAIGLLETSSAISPPTEDKDALLLLALYNNIGHIYSCDHKSGDIQNCLEKIRKILAARTQQGGHDAISSAHGFEYLDFHLNVVILHGTRRHPPAA